MPSHSSSDDALHLAAVPDPDETVGQLVGEASARPDVAPASAIGRYVVLDLLGVGGMGVVCTAYDPKLDRKVALKLLRDREGVDESQASHGRARLLREAQALAKLSHPNIITVHDVDTFEGQLYIAMEYVEGQTIKGWLEAGPHGWREIVRVFVQAGRGLAAAHAAGITHRDFKPANVLMGDDGRVRVVDFGLAKGREERELEQEVERTTGRHGPSSAIDRGIIDMMRSASSSDLTQIGHSVGTPAYMAPEQHMGFGMGPHTDQFSFCVSLYEALYGVLPFAGDSIEAKFQNMVEGNLREAPRDAQVPTWIHRALERGLRPQAADRFPDMNQLLAQLSRDPAKRRRRIATVAAFIGLTGVAAFGAYQASAGANELCEGAEARLVDVWDEGTRKTVQAAFVGTGKPYAEDAWTRVSSALDDYTARWTTLHHEVCAATHVRGEQSEALLDVRMACLERRLAQVDALVDVYAQADDDVVIKAATSVDSLDDVEACAKAQALPEKQAMPTDPGVRAQVEQVQRDLAVVVAQRTAGEHDGTLELARSVATRARQLPHLPTRAEASLEFARAQKNAGELKAARESFEQAVRSAAEADDARLEATGWANLIDIVGYREHQPEVGLSWVLAADAALARIDDARLARQNVVNAVASVHFGKGEYREAEKLYREAVALLREVYGENSPRTTAPLGNLASALGAQRKFAEAEPIARQAVELTRLRMGSKHPDLAGALQNHGNVLGRLDREDEARACHEEALEIREQSLPAGHLSIADSLASVAGEYKRAGELERALEYDTRALAIYRKGLEPDHPKLAQALNNLGALERERGNHDASLAYHREALAVAEKRLAPEHPRVATTRRHICRALKSLGRLQEALEECQRSVAAYAAGANADGLAEGLNLEAELSRALGRNGDAERALRRAIDALANDEDESATSLAAKTRFALAQVLWTRSAGRAEALELANAARAAFAKAKDDRMLEVESWIRGHRLP